MTVEKKPTPGEIKNQEKRARAYKAKADKKTAQRKLINDELNEWIVKRDKAAEIFDVIGYIKAETRISEIKQKLASLRGSKLFK